MNQGLGKPVFMGDRLGLPGSGLSFAFIELVVPPRRLWQRYLVNGSKFAWNVALELLGVKKFE